MKNELNPNPPNAESQNLLSDLKSLIEQGKKTLDLLDFQLFFTYFIISSNPN